MFKDFQQGQWMDVEGVGPMRLFITGMNEPFVQGWREPNGDWVKEITYPAENNRVERYVNNKLVES